MRQPNRTSLRVTIRGLAETYGLRLLLECVAEYCDEVTMIRVWSQHFRAAAAAQEPQPKTRRARVAARAR